MWRGEEYNFFYPNFQSNVGNVKLNKLKSYLSIIVKCLLSSDDAFSFEIATYWKHYSYIIWKTVIRKYTYTRIIVYLILKCDKKYSYKNNNNKIYHNWNLQQIQHNNWQLIHIYILKQPLEMGCPMI